MAERRRTTDRDLLRRQRALAAFGELALSSEDLGEILTEGCRLVADALGTQRAKILEIEGDGDCLLVRAGVGWGDDIVGNLRLPMNHHCSETFSIKAGEPVFTENIEREDRFDVPEFMKQAGVVAFVNVPIFLPGRKPYGLLQVDSRKPRNFAREEHAQFLKTYAAILGPVIDRLHKAHSLQAALETNMRLLREMQHRIKNHIGLIMSVVHLRLTEAKTAETCEALNAVAERIETLRLLHEQLYVGGRPERLRLRPFAMQLVEQLCHLHERDAGRVRLDFMIDELEVRPDLAVPLGLIVNEFVTNSLKYAFDGEGGTIGVCIDQTSDKRIRVRLTDDGIGIKGLSDDKHETGPTSGTGMKLIDGLARQVGAEAIWSLDSGVILRLEFNAC